MSPLYPYECPDGHRTVRLKKMADSAKPVKCPYCGEQAERVIAKHSPPIVKGGTPTFHK